MADKITERALLELAYKMLGEKVKANESDHKIVIVPNDGETSDELEARILKDTGISVTVNDETDESENTGYYLSMAFGELLSSYLDVACTSAKIDYNENNELAGFSILAETTDKKTLEITVEIKEN